MLVYELYMGNLQAYFVSPEKRIVGQWKERYWNYNLSEENKFIAQNELHNLLSKKFYRHKSEVWDIKDDQTLDFLYEDGHRITAKWKLVGRGHILKIIHRNGIAEYFQIEKLNKRRMVLYVENDIHAKGKIKITFRKNAKKIQ